MDPKGDILGGAASDYNSKNSFLKKEFFIFSLYFFLAVFLYGLAATLQFDLIHKSPSDWMNSYIGLLGSGGDPVQFIWFLSWWPYALSHGLDPFQTHAIWSPSGVNLLWVTSVPGLSLLIWPFLHLVGPIASYNILMTLAPVLSASAAYLLAYEITGSWISSFLGGYFFGFSSYEIIYSDGAPNLSFVVLVPLILFVLLRSLNRNWSLLFSGLLIGVLLLFQFLVSTEILATFTLFLGISMLCFYIFIPESRKKIELAIARILLGYLFCFLFLLPIYSPLLHGQVFGGGTAPSAYNSGNDLLSPIIPQNWRVFGKTLDGSVSYIGFPLLLIILLIVKKHRANPLEKGLLLCLGIFSLASMGPTLHIAGFCLSTLPWTIFEHLPLIGYALADRFFLYSWLVIGLLVALWLKNTSVFSEKMVQFTLIFLGIIFIWPNHDTLGRWIPTHIPKVFSSGEICHKVEGGKRLIILPWGVHGDSELYQVASGMCFTMPECYTGAVPYPFNLWPLNYRLVRDRFDAVPPAIFGSYLSTYHVGAIAVLHNIRNKSAAEALLTAVGFKRTGSIGMVDLYKSSRKMTFPIVDDVKLKNIGIERERHLREKVIIRNRQEIKSFLAKTGVVSPETGENLYSWLLDHHILK